MASSSDRFVIRWGTETPKYLVLLGVFEYPASTDDIQLATQLLRSQAYRYQEMVGGEIVQLG
jgi:hypothetical protein